MKIPTTKIVAIDHIKAGAKIRAMREKRKISLRAFAAAMGIGSGYLSDLERGRRNWTEFLWDKATSCLMSSVV